MSTGFDPYHAWLGLPPGTRPSNHYELLGLKLFASEPPVIAEAADERLAKVKPLLAGPQGAVAKQLFDELTAARAALLSPAARRAYDAQLRTQLGMPPAAEARPTTTKTMRPSAPTVVMPPAPLPAAPAAPVPAAAPTVVMAQAQTPMGQTPMGQAPMAAIPVATQPMPVAAVPYGAPMVAQAVPMMAPGVAQAMPVMPGYASGVPMAQPAMAQPMMAQPMMAQPMMAQPMMAQPVMAGYGVPAADEGLDEMGNRRRRRRRASSGQMTAVLAGLIIAGGVGAFAYVYREPLLAALEDKPPIVIHEGDQNPVEAPQPKQAVAEDAHKPVKPAAEMPQSMQPPGDQMATNMSVAPPVQPPKRVRPKPSVVVKAKPPAAAVSIKPRSPEEKAAVGRSLAAARYALGERNPGKFEEQMNLAMLEASSSESMAAIYRMRSLDDAYKEFWHAVRESVKGLKSVDEVEVDGKKMIVIDADSEHLSVRADGQSRDYQIAKLPTNMALSLARQWLQPGDPSSKVVLGAFLAVDPKGDRQQARQLWQQAAGQGSEVAKTLLAQDAD